MKTMQYDNRTFLLIPGERSAIRHHKTDRIEVLTWTKCGEMQCRSKTVSPGMFQVVKSLFEREGIA